MQPPLYTVKIFNRGVKYFKGWDLVLDLIAAFLNPQTLGNRTTASDFE
jgi:hypothetical protein